MSSQKAARAARARLRTKVVLLVAGISVALLASAPLTRGPEDWFIGVVLFPTGLAFYAKDLIESRTPTVGLLMLWLPFLVLGAATVAVRKRAMWVCLYVAFLALLAANVAGCYAASQGWQGAAAQPAVAPDGHMTLTNDRG